VLLPWYSERLRMFATMLNACGLGPGGGGEAWPLCARLLLGAYQIGASGAKLGLSLTWDSSRRVDGGRGPMLKPLLAGTLALSFAACPSPARTAGGGSDVTLGPETTPRTSRTCVEIEIGGAKAGPLDCLNRQLKDQVNHVQPSGNIPPLDAAAPSVTVGGFNATAMSQQYGQSWGKSVVPFRPPKPTFAAPVRP
jgi:hypothetical protein